MLAKTHRLAKNSDVTRVVRAGRSFFSPMFIIKFVRGSTAPRFTVVVSTKVSKLAVVRNRIKRVLREYVRLRLQGFVLGDYMIIVRTQAAKLPAEELRGSLDAVFKRSGLIKNI